MNSTLSQASARFPVVRTAGIDGMLVTFADQLTEPGNRAALAFRAALEDAAWDGIGETATSLASVFLRFDPLVVSHDGIAGALRDLLASRDWYDAPMPSGRRLWRVPTVYGTDLAPQLDEAADAAGLDRDEAINRLGSSRVRVLTIGFAPGQPYLGPLGPEWNLPRLQELTPMVPQGALVLAISQFVLFAGPTPTGWRHVGQTAFRCFRPHSDTPIALRPGDEMIFEPVARAVYERLRDTDTTGDGGATREDIGS